MALKTSNMLPESTALPDGAVGFCSPEQGDDKKDNKNVTHDDPLALA